MRRRGQRSFLEPAAFATLLAALLALSGLTVILLRLEAAAIAALLSAALLFLSLLRVLPALVFFVHRLVHGCSSAQCPRTTRERAESLRAAHPTSAIGNRFSSGGFEAVGGLSRATASLIVATLIGATERSGRSRCGAFRAGRAAP